MVTFYVGLETSRCCRSILVHTYGGRFRHDAWVLIFGIPAGTAIEKGNKLSAAVFTSRNSTVGSADSVVLFNMNFFALLPIVGLLSY